MMYKDVADLISIEIYKDNLHQQKEREIPRTVYVDKLPITQGEFFTAGQNGFKPRLAFKMKSIDYNNETVLKYNNAKYSIYRTYDKGEEIELYCEFKVGAK